MGTRRDSTPRISDGWVLRNMFNEAGLEERLERVRGHRAEQVFIDEVRSMPNTDIDELLKGVEEHQKKALPNPNAANLIERHLKRYWPELVDLRGLWFTGSQVWSHLYGMTPPPKSDLDVIAESDEAHGLIKITLARLLRDPRPEEKSTTSMGGEQLYLSDGRQIDVWQNRNAVAAIRDYASASHGHARAAYSTYHGALILLPNETAK